MSEEERREREEGQWRGRRRRKKEEEWRGRRDV